MATSGTDLLFFAMLAGGGILVVMNWKCLSDGTFCGLGGGSGCSGGNANCTWGCDGAYCWTGKCGSTSYKTCTEPGQSGDRTSGCALARTSFLARHPASSCPGGTNCSGGYIPSGNSCVCNPSVKNCTGSSQCVVHTPTTCQCNSVSNAQCPAGKHACKTADGACACCPNSGGGCTKGYVPCSGGCCCNRTLKKCTSGQIVGLLNGVCSCQNCPTGTKAGGTNGNSCVPIGGSTSICGNQGNGAQAWIARVATAILGRMCNNCGKNPSITTILQGYPSLTMQLAVENNCNTNKLHKSNATFNKHFANLLIAIVNAYHIPIIKNAADALVVQSGNGVYWMTPWDGGVASYAGQANLNDRPNPFQDNRPGDSYARALEGRYNRWNPYGDNRYAYTLPTNMKVRVS